MEAVIGAFRCAFTCKHPDGVFTGAPIGENSGRVRIVSRQIFAHQEGKQLPPVSVSRHADLGDHQAAQGFLEVGTGNFAATHFI